MKERKRERRKEGKEEGKKEGGKGVDIRCQGEGEAVPVPPEVERDNPCISCSCLKSIVVCSKRRCPQLEGCYWKLQQAQGQCCQLCKGCVYKGEEYPHGARWSDGCSTFQCEAGVLTVSKAQCHLPCYHPLPSDHSSTCCQSCPECWLEGRRVGEGEGVSSRADPCVRCMCLGGKLTCHKKACPVLSCPPGYRIPAPDGCCMTCQGSRELISPPGGRCFLNGALYTTGSERRVDPCTTCMCHDGYITCQRVTCPVLNCSHHHQVTREGECCPECSAGARLESSCILHGLTHSPGEQWQLDKCTTCVCHSGTVSCHTPPCQYLNKPCPPGMKRVESESECCPRCEEAPGTCVVFGDPHYRTFDGLLYTFQGACHYTLAEECGRGKNFSVRVSNDAPRSHSQTSSRTHTYARTRSLTLRLKGVKVKMCQKLRTKVNGKMVQPPFTHKDGLFNLTKAGQALSLTTSQGVKVVWDGWSYTEVEVPLALRGLTCGLCGNFNGNSSDDLTTRGGRLVKNADRMAATWSTGRARQCRRRLSRNQASLENQHSSVLAPAKPRAARSCRASHSRAMTQCGLLNATVFLSCHSVVPVDMFYESCMKDMCECRASRRCECDTLLAYARQCQRLGISVEEWRGSSKCGGLECPRGAEYMTCAPPCRANCRNPTPNPRCHTRRCRAGCYCPHPTVLHRGACISPDKCRVITEVQMKSSCRPAVLTRQSYSGHLHS
ncbi:hypothetical protein Pcinc_032049 [Petrolisthes cinctipes]|uniref:BMP-binding endothelial regulator protein n=1 Tax=Petrolisthes cinctipes TaxID=88211 RepID=A0AAE1JZW6_PETCI|nr:hypothetical protein Pcinc_032049 [Petrolisthes cinctipes]